MCRACKPEDPRDALSHADNALACLQILLDQQTPGETVVAHDVAAALYLIGEKMRPAVEAIQTYVPGNRTPPVG